MHEAQQSSRPASPLAARNDQQQRRSQTARQPRARCDAFVHWLGNKFTSVVLKEDEEMSSVPSEWKDYLPLYKSAIDNLEETSKAFEAELISEYRKHDPRTKTLMFLFEGCELILSRLEGSVAAPNHNTAVASTR